MRSLLFRLISLSNLLARFQPGDSGPAPDPRAGVRVPRSSGPGGRTSAIALTEPNEPRETVSAVSGGRRH